MLKSNTNPSPTAERPWFSHWFQQDYYDYVYNHRSVDEAKIAVRLLFNLIGEYNNLNLGKISCLDIGCGNGRHLIYLGKELKNIIGLDLSLRQLGNARTQIEHNTLPLVNADMRSLPFSNESFALITNFFTSFGYFQSDSEHQATLSNWSEKLLDEGLLFIDLFNKNHVIDSFNPLTISENGSYSITQERSLSIGNKRIEKRIIISKDGIDKIFNESVRIFSLEELSTMLKLAGLKIVDIKGSYSGEVYRDNSERLIILAKKCKK